MNYTYLNICFKWMYLYLLIFLKFLVALLVVASFCFLLFGCASWHMGSSSTREQAHVPALEAWSLNHWTTREVPIY